MTRDDEIAILNIINHVLGAERGCPLTDREVHFIQSETRDACLIKGTCEECKHNNECFSNVIHGVEPHECSLNDIEYCSLWCKQ